MKFATKLSLGCIALLSCALGAAGLLLTGQSFSGSLASTRTALQAQQEKEKYALERFIFQATDSAQFENYILASAGVEVHQRIEVFAYVAFFQFIAGHAVHPLFNLPRWFFRCR